MCSKRTQLPRRFSNFGNLLGGYSPNCRASPTSTSPAEETTLAPNEVHPLQLAIAAEVVQPAAKAGETRQPSLEEMPEWRLAPSHYDTTATY